MIRKIGKEGKRYNAFRRKFLKDKSDWGGLFECEHCHMLTDSPIVDHKQKRSSHPELKYVESNLQILCPPCNEIETAKKP